MLRLYVRSSPNILSHVFLGSAKLLFFPLLRIFRSRRMERSAWFAPSR